MFLVRRGLACLLWIVLGLPALGQETPPSAAGQRIYEGARESLVQVRTVLRGQDSQAAVGSGFLVSSDGHLITNYHVVSEAALQPRRHRLVYATADGRAGGLELLAVDVVHDLALLRAVDREPLSGRGALAFRPVANDPARGERVYALGNPLDVGFAVVEGVYNGLAERSFVPTIFFGGSLSAGMSGGPALDEQGLVMGINVATRRDGEQVSFLVPAAPAQALLERGRDAAPVAEPLYREITRQLLAHQEHLTDRFLALSWRSAGHHRYAIPVPQEEFMRCWGSVTPAGSRGLEFERSDCAMDSRIFVSHALVTGHVAVRHEAYDGRRLGTLRFAERYSGSFQNESFGVKTMQITAPMCHEGEVVVQGGAAPDAGPARASPVRGGTPAAPIGASGPAESAGAQQKAPPVPVADEGLHLRAVMCLRAYRKLPGLYDVSVLVATLEDTLFGAQGRFDARGVSYDNALRLATHYLRGYEWQSTDASR